MGVFAPHICARLSMLLLLTLLRSGKLYDLLSTTGVVNMTMGQTTHTTTHY